MCSELAYLKIKTCRLQIRDFWRIWHNGLTVSLMRGFNQNFRSEKIHCHRRWALTTVRLRPIGHAVKA